MNVFLIFAKGWQYAKLIPVVVFFMTQVELAMPGDPPEIPGAPDTRSKSEKKLALFRGYLEEFWNGAQDSFGDINEAWPFINRIVTRFAPILFPKQKDK